MATLEEKLCPVCFREAMEGGKCQNCGYVSDEASVGKNYLRSFSILNTKYLLGKSLGQGGFGITYLAKNLVLFQKKNLLYLQLPVINLTPIFIS